MPNPQDTHASVPEELLVYESSNGDTWSLCEDPSTGLPAVKHVASLQSGGHVSYLEVESFLSGENGPEHQALRQLLKQDDLSTILIACDIHTQQRLGAMIHPSSVLAERENGGRLRSRGGTYASLPGSRSQK